MHQYLQTDAIVLVAAAIIYFVAFRHGSAAAKTKAAAAQIVADAKAVVPGKAGK